MACSLLAAHSAAEPAHFWFSLSGNDPYRHSYYEPSGSLPGSPQIDLIPNAAQTIYLWAQPQTLQPGAYSAGTNLFRTLQNFALNLDVPPTTPDPQVICLTGVDVLNPVTGGKPRFLRAVDSAEPIELIDDTFQEVSYPNFFPHGPGGVGGAEGIELFAGFSLGDPATFSGFGDDCSGPYCHQSLTTPPAWLIGAVEVRALRTGLADAWLQIGAPGITHLGETQPQTQVVFGSGSVEYDAALHREQTLGPDGPDLQVRVVDHWPGDFNQDGSVDAADYSVWRDGFDLGNTNLQDYADYRAHFGRVPPGTPPACPTAMTGAHTVPEPTAVGFILVAGLAAGCSSRPVRRGLTILVVCVVLPASLTEQATAQIPSEWTGGGTGSDWDDPDNWTSINFPNNDGGDLYDVTIAMTPGPTLGLGLDILLNNLSISGDMSIDSAMLEVSNPVQIDGGTLTLNAGAELFGGIDLVSVGSTLTINEPAAILGNEIRLLNGGSMLSLEGAPATDFEIDAAGSLILSGAGASVQALAGRNLINRGTIRATDTADFMSINDLTNTGLLEVTGGTLTANLLGAFNNSGVMRVASGATLTVFPSTPFVHTGTAELQGTGVVQIDSNADGFINFLDIFQNDAIIRPGDSPGILTIESSYEQLDDGVLEIEIEGTTPGTEHDQLLVMGGGATLDGRVDLLVDYTPTLGDTITFLDAASVTGVFDRYRATGLSSTVGVELLYTATEAKARFAAPVAIGFSPSSSDVVWGVGGNWASGTAPTSLSNVRLESGAPALTIRVQTPAAGSINAAHSLVVGGGDATVDLRIESVSLSVSTVTTVGADGQIDLIDASSRLVSPDLHINHGGRLKTAGAFTGDLIVGRFGTTSGRSVMELEGSPTVEGTYTQTSVGALEVDIDASVISDVHDRLAVTGDATLAGALRIDATLLDNTEFVPGAYYDILSTESTLSGEFSAVEVVGRDDIYFDVLYGGPPPSHSNGVASASAELTTSSQVVRVGGYFKGDVVGTDNKIDEKDAKVFAAMLLNNGTKGVDWNTANNVGNDPSAHIDPLTRNALLALDFEDLRADKDSDPLVVDFYDVAGFAQAMATVNGMSLSEAYATISYAIEEAQRDQVPEPGGLAIAALGLLLAGFNLRNREPR